MKPLQLLQVAVWNTMKSIDYRLFKKINIEWRSSFLDTVCPFIREAYIWIPFYIFLILFAALNFKKKGWYWCLFLIITASLSDTVSSTIIKQHIFRLRPCHDPSLAGAMHLLVNYCPRSSGFTSSHATNHFAVAMFTFITFRETAGKWWGLLFFWAFIISYAQVYVGVHFPLDVICGGILGLLIGYLPGRIFNKKIGLRI